MITLYGFGRIFPEGRGETKDLRVQWALEELGLPYRVHALDHTGGELDTPEYVRLNPFRQAPVLDDDGFIVSESAAIVLYLAEKAGALIPGDMQGRTRVTQWCFSAVSSLEPSFTCLDVLDIFDREGAAAHVRSEVQQLTGRWLGHIEGHLQGRTWIACSDFTVADIMLAGVLRCVRKTDLLSPFPCIVDYFARCQARPAWQRTLRLSAERLGMTVDEIR